VTRPEAVTWLAEKLPTDPEIKGLDPVATQQWKKREKGRLGWDQSFKIFSFFG
jgi:hypothetical protein